LLWPYLYDLIFILILLLMIRRGWRTGIFASVLRLAGWVVALLLIVAFSEQMATWIFENLLRDRVVAAVSAAIPRDVLNSIGAGAAATQDTLTAVQGILDQLGGLIGDTSINTQSLQGVLDLMQIDGETLAEAITDNILRPAVISGVQIIVAVLIFLVSVTVFKLLSRMTARRHRRRGRRGLNSLLGAVLGALEGFAAVFIYSFVLGLLAELGADKLRFISPTILNDTILVRLLVK